MVKIHEYIAHYAKTYGDRYTRKIHLPYDQKYIDDWFKYTDENGRRYQRRQRGRDADGAPIWERQYLDESKGVPASTVWTDIKQIYADPRAYKGATVTNSELGLPGCTRYAVLPRLGPVGLLTGWWRVKVSSGCP